MTISSSVGANGGGRRHPYGGGRRHSLAVGGGIPRRRVEAEHGGGWRQSTAEIDHGSGRGKATAETHPKEYTDGGSIQWRMNSSCLIVAHGGEWNENIYEGGRKEYIPIPPTRITFDQFLSKLEVRLKKDRSMYVFDVDALVMSPEGETMRMKITDEFEWCSMLDLLEVPTVYVTICPGISEGSHSRSIRDDSWKKDIFNAQKNKHMVAADDEIDLESSTDCDDTNDSNDDESVDINDHNVGGCSRDLHTVPSLDTNNESNEVNNVENQKDVRQWMILGGAHQANLSCEDVVIPYEPVTNELVMGAIFRDKLTMTTVVGSHHMKNHLQTITVRSSSTRYHLACKFGERCEFIMRSSSMGKAWKINQWRAHTCEMDLRYHPRRRISTKVVAAEFLDNLTEDGYVLRPCDMQSKLLRDHGVTVNYRTALAGKNHALNQSYGDADKSFQLLPKYLYMLENLNPGSIVDLRTCDDGSFQFVFFALHACVRAFSKCRPVIVIDGTHLRGKYKGIMFIAATKDGNKQIVPLAFGIGDKENDLSWTWFLQQVRRTFGCPGNLLIVSDQHLSIKNALEAVYPGVHHGLCSFHIQRNLTKAGFGAFVIDIFKAAATAYKSRDFEEHMQNLLQSAPRAYERLMKLDPIKWAICKCPVRRYGMGTSNAVENLNARIKWARKLPVCALLEYCRNICQEWFYKRRTIADSRSQELSEYATLILEIAIDNGRYMKVDPITNIKFKVISESKTHIVDIVSRECSCHVFDLDLIPCAHATSALR
ncbi:hypothetical protein OROMI_017995 [Orobanche minor]